MSNVGLFKPPLPQAAQVRGAALLEEFYFISKGAWLRTLQFMNESQKGKKNTKAQCLAGNKPTTLKFPDWKDAY